MKTKFSIKMTVSDMYQFLMHHTFHTSAGPVSIIASFAVLGFLFYSFYSGKADVTSTILYIIFAVMFFAYHPYTLAKAALRQIKANPVYQFPIEYEISEEELRVSQKSASDSITWEGVVKVKETKKAIYIYTGKKNAFILPKNQMKEDGIKTIRTLAGKKLDAKRVKVF